MTNQSSKAAVASSVPIYIPDVLSSSSPKSSTTEGVEEDHAYKYPSIYKNHFSSVLIPYSQIQSRTNDIASIIHSDYPMTEPLVLICILKGACPFFNCLSTALSELHHPFTLEFTRISSYVGTQSSGSVNVNHHTLDLKNLKDRHVLIVEDIVETGNTLSKFLPMIQECCPKSLQVCTFLTKRLPQGQQQEQPNNGSSCCKINIEKDLMFDVKYVGFSIGDEFVVGFGLDYNEMYRDLKDLWILGKKGIEFGGLDGMTK